jgi:hypothetical protein
MKHKFLLNYRAMMVQKVMFHLHGERFGVVQVKIPVFWDLMPCTVVIMFWRSLLPPLHCLYSEMQLLRSEGMNEMKEPKIHVGVEIGYMAQLVGALCCKPEGCRFDS